MNNLSFWAKNNPHIAQVLITIGHVLTIVFCIQLGVLSLTVGIELPNWLFLLLASLLIVAVCLYPSKNDYPTSQKYHAQRRYFDILLLATGVLITVVGTNRFTSAALDFAADISQNGRVNAAPSSGTVQFVVYKDLKQSLLVESEKKTTSSKVQKSSVKQWFQKRMVNRYHLFASSSIPNDTKIPLMILLSLGIIVAEWGIFVLACNIACSGMQALSLVVFLGGLFGLSALTSLALRRIYPDMPKKNRIGTAFIMVAIPILIALIYGFAQG